MGTLKFEGKIVLITGASSGIGAGLARELARQGASLVLLARRKVRLDLLTAELKSAGSRVLAIEGDVTRDGDLEAAVVATVREFGRLDGAIANAGYAEIGKVSRLKLEDFRRQFETNVFGVLRTVQAVLPELEKSKGFIALMGSVNGYVSLPGVSPYCMSKFAVRSLAECLVDEVASKGISVTLISPGFVESEIRDDSDFKIPNWIVMKTDVAARKMIRAIARRKREAVITGHGQIVVFLQRHFPGLLVLFKKLTERAQ